MPPEQATISPHSPHPKISVVMAAFNTGPFIREAIHSILTQTEQDFELLIVNDGSTDDTEATVQSYKSDKLRYYANPKNVGISRTRNRAINLARGEYIAIVDSDDISHPQRLAIQADFLQRHPQVGVVSGQTKHFAHPAAPTGFRPIRMDKIKVAYTPEQNRELLVFGTPKINNPAAMIRASVLVQNNFTFDVNLPLEEDNDLYRILGTVTDLVMLNHDLVYYRLHLGNTCKRYSAIHNAYAVKSKNDFLKNYFNTDVSAFFDDAGHPKVERYGDISDAIEKLVHSTQNNPKFSSEMLHRAGVSYLYGKLREIARQTDDYGVVYNFYRNSALLRHLDIGEKLKINLKYLYFLVLKRKLRSNPQWKTNDTK